MLFGAISVFRFSRQRCQIGVGVWAPLDHQTAMFHRNLREFDKMRTSFTKTLIALAITTVAAFGADNTLGTWKLNVAKSKYTPATNARQEPDRHKGSIGWWREADNHRRTG